MRLVEPKPISLKEFEQWKAAKKPITFFVDQFIERGASDELELHLVKQYVEQIGHGKNANN